MASWQLALRVDRQYRTYANQPIPTKNLHGVERFAIRAALAGLLLQ
jgi:hypothetical protein